MRRTGIAAGIDHHRNQQVLRVGDARNFQRVFVTLFLVAGHLGAIPESRAEGRGIALSDPIVFGYGLHRIDIEPVAECFVWLDGEE